LIFINNKIQVKASSVKGSGKYKELGVFAIDDIKEGEIVEVAPLIVLKFEELIDTNWNTLFDYYFWMDDYVVLALGYGSIYNHSENSNIEYEIMADKRMIKFIANKNIKSGEELFFNYRGKDESKTPLWFEREGKIS
jgi:SET domain-containing protein